MARMAEVELTTLLELRQRLLTPGHPGRPVLWPYDNELATHFGMFHDEQLIGCVSITPEPMPGRSAIEPYHLHSMALEPAYRGRGLGRSMLATVRREVQARGGDLIWATARPAAVDFYRRCGFEEGQQVRIQPTNALMHYVCLTL